ncbi:hypothetical protein [Nibricoccus sp. IMCC34717]|uniref:WD40/YVTN/BNR-like repeat-containing protein n=1 Tax=Nibricoccus sp. IMCC34717 TaxID=3034021 RepID=UPI00384DC6B9
MKNSVFSGRYGFWRRVLAGVLVCWACVLTRAQPLDFTVRYAETGGAALWGVAETSAGIIAVGTGGKILSSRDGSRWASVDSGTTRDLYAVCDDGRGTFIVVGDKGTILRSTDAVTWTPAKNSATSQRLNGVAWDNGLFVAVGEKGTLVYSENGDTWTAVDTGVTGWLRVVTRDGAYWVSMGQNGDFLWSIDGREWKAIPGDGSVDIEAAASNGWAWRFSLGYRFFEVVGSPSLAGRASFIRYGQNDWEAPRMEYYTSANVSPSWGRLRGVCKSGNTSVAVGEGGVILTKQEAASYVAEWDVQPQLLAVNYNACATGLGRVWIVGADATIVVSSPFVPSRVGSISTRGTVGTGANVLIAGVSLQGTSTQRVLIRAAGPSLAKFGVSGCLGDPVLKLYRGSELLAQSDNWSDGGNFIGQAITADELSGIMASSGAFSFERGSRDAAMVVALRPGEYTAVVEGAGGSTGVALVEVYRLTEY